MILKLLYTADKMADNGMDSKTITQVHIKFTFHKHSKPHSGEAMHCLIVLVHYEQEALLSKFITFHPYPLFVHIHLSHN